MFGRQALVAADAAIVPVLPGYHELRALARGLELLDEGARADGSAVALLGVLVVNADPRWRTTREYGAHLAALAAADELALFETSIPRHQPVTGHARLGRPTVIVSPRCSVAVAYRELACEVEERIAALFAETGVDGVLDGGGRGSRRRRGDLWRPWRMRARRREETGRRAETSPPRTPPAPSPISPVRSSVRRGNGAGCGSQTCAPSGSGGRPMTASDGMRPLPGRRTDTLSPARSSDAFGAAPTWTRGADVLELAVDAIQPNPDQPRRRFDEAGLRALAGSLRERGLLQPVLVSPADADGHHALIAGERRWRAAKLAGLERLPAFIRDDSDGASRLELALIENAAREDLTPVEEARTLHALISDLGVTQAELARRIGRSRADLANTMRLLDLPDDVLELIDDGQLSKGHGKVLLAVREPGRRSRLARRASEREWSVRELERAIASRPSDANSSVGDDRRELARQLSARLAASFGESTTVTARHAGFAIQLIAADRGAAERLVERLTGSRE